ncbi:MAG: LamG-like jellyroll fold domain-containing protein [Methanoregula sp.]|nr:LamG-like jellyroll fold domain-containing protein [Methanoregula sp.]
MQMTLNIKTGQTLAIILFAGILVSMMISPAMGLTAASNSLTDNSSPDQFDHYVSFYLRVNSLAPNYAYDLVTLGDKSDGSKWVYNFYLFGTDGDGDNGRIQVWGMNNTFTRISPSSERLEPGTDYFVVWRYSGSNGGELFINNVSQGEAVKGGGANGDLSSAFHIGENMYNGGGRQHSKFNGRIWDVHLYVRSPGSENDTEGRIVLEKSRHGTVAETKAFSLSAKELSILAGFMEKYSTISGERERILSSLSDY